jgi:hypothetical protein
VFRPTGALRLPSSPVRPALAGSILSFALLCALPSATEAKHAKPQLPAEAVTAPTAEAEAPPTTAPSPREGRKRGHGKDPQTAPVQGEAPAEVSPAVTGNGKSRRHDHRHRAGAGETAVEEPAGTSVAPASADSEGRAGAQAKNGQSRKEREREQRRKEREARKEEAGHKETRKERLAREAEEAREREAPVATPTQPTLEVVTAVSAAAPVVSAPVVGADSTGSALPGVIGETAAASSGGRRRAKSGRRHAAGLASSTDPLALGVSSGAIVPAAAKPVKHLRGSAKGSKPTHEKSSELVRTVTRIIGVIPAGLWILIGALAALALAFAVSSRLSGARAKRLARQRRDLLQDVGLLQAALLPELPVRIGPVGTSAAYRPASGPAAGGDFYDVFALADGRLGLIVGDVSGHGRGSLPHTTLLRFTLRAYLEAGLSPRESLRAAAPVLERQLDGSFATVVLASYDPRKRLLTYSCAGHPHPIVRGLRDIPITACSAPPVGMGSPTGTRQTVISIPGEAQACFYTDGVIEARVDGELFGSERLERSLAALPDPSLAAALLDRVSHETDARPDDMAACILGVEGAAVPASIVLEELELSARDLKRDRVRKFLLAAGVEEAEIAPVLEAARDLLEREGRALLKIRLDSGSPEATLVHDNVASFSARAIARTQEVAL